MRRGQGGANSVLTCDGFNVNIVAPPTGGIGCDGASDVAGATGAHGATGMPGQTADTGRGSSRPLQRTPVGSWR